LTHQHLSLLENKSFVFFIDLFVNIALDYSWLKSKNWLFFLIGKLVMEIWFFLKTIKFYLMMKSFNNKVR